MLLLLLSNRRIQTGGIMEKNLTAHYMLGLIAEKKRELKLVQKDLKKLEKMRAVLLEEENNESSNS